MLPRGSRTRCNTRTSRSGFSNKTRGTRSASFSRGNLAGATLTTLCLYFVLQTRSTKPGFFPSLGQFIFLTSRVLLQKFGVSKILTGRAPVQGVETYDRNFVEAGEREKLQAIMELTT